MADIQGKDQRQVLQLIDCASLEPPKVCNRQGRRLNHSSKVVFAMSRATISAFLPVFSEGCRGRDSKPGPVDAGIAIIKLSRT